MNKRVLTILLALAMLASNFAGCAENAGNDETEAPAETSALSLDTETETE